MPVLAILSAIKGFAGTVLGLIAKYPWQALCALLAALGAWCWHGWSHEQARHKADKAIWAQQVAANQAAEAKAKQDAKDAANDADKYHAQLIGAQQGLRDYIAVHSVSVRKPSQSAAPASASANPGVHADTAPVPTVEVPANVLDIADANYAYADACYQWGQSLIVKGRAIPALPTKP